MCEWNMCWMPRCCPVELDSAVRLQEMRRLEGFSFFISLSSKLLASRHSCLLPSLMNGASPSSQIEVSTAKAGLLTRQSVQLDAPKPPGWRWSQSYRRKTVDCWLSFAGCQISKSAQTPPVVMLRIGTSASSTDTQLLLHAWNIATEKWGAGQRLVQLYKNNKSIKLTFLCFHGNEVTCHDTWCNGVVVRLKKQYFCSLIQPSIGGRFMEWM